MPNSPVCLTGRLAVSKALQARAIYTPGIHQKASPGNSSTILIAFNSQLFDGFHCFKKKKMRKSVRTEEKIRKAGLLGECSLKYSASSTIDNKPTPNFHKNSASFEIRAKKSQWVLHSNPAYVGHSFLVVYRSYFGSTEFWIHWDARCPAAPVERDCPPIQQQPPICTLPQRDLLAFRRPLHPTLNNVFIISKEEEKKC